MEEISRNKWAYLRMVYALSGFNTLFYLVRFNFEFNVPDYNWILIPCWALMMVVPPAFIQFTGSYKAAAISLCFLATLLTDILVFLSGGLEAAGLLWMASIPLVLGMLLGIRGAAVGYVSVIVTMVFFFYCNANGIGPNLIAEHGNVKLEKIINLCGFIVFASVTALHYNKREERVAAKIIKKSDDIERFLGVLMHDMANALSNMTYDLVRHKESAKDLRTGEIRKIEKAMEEIDTLLFQVRHLKSIKDGKTRLPLKGVSLTMILNDVFELIERSAQEKGVKLVLDLSREKLFVNGDKTILSNVVLLNLMTNAIKFSHPGDCVELKAYADQHKAVVEVRDYGIGIPTHILGNLFNISAKNTRPGTFGESGTGYGLPLVKEYLQLMGGKIEVDSWEEGRARARRGTLVKVSMPLAS